MNAPGTLAGRWLQRTLVVCCWTLLTLASPGLRAQEPLPFAACLRHAGEQRTALPFFPSRLLALPGLHEAYDSEAARLLSAYIRHPSVSGHEREAGAWFMEYCAARGLYVEELSAPDGTFNMVASLFPLHEGRPNYIFLHHIDVVDAGDTSLWRFEPFSGTIAEGQVWGRGAYDNKGVGVIQVLAMLSVMERARAEDWPFNVSLLAVSGEETFHPGGAAYVADNHLELLRPAALIGEGPAGIRGLVADRPDGIVFGISVSHKRALWLRLTLDYESSGHGSVPPANYPNKDMIAAVNRILHKRQKVRFDRYNASMLQALGDMEGGFKGFFMKNVHLLQPVARHIIRRDPLYNSFFSNTINLTRIANAGGAHNSIPTHVEAILDCRLLPGTSTDDFLRRMRRTMKNDRIRIEVLRETPDAPPTDPDMLVYASLEQAILGRYPDAYVVPVMLQATIDSNFFRARGVPAYCTVPILMTRALLSRVHSTDERVPIPSLEGGTDVLTDFLLELAARSRSSFK